MIYLIIFKNLHFSILIIINCSLLITYKAVPENEKTLQKINFVGFGF